MKTFLFIMILLVVFGGIIWFLGNREGEEAGFPRATPTPTQPTVSPTLTPLSSPSLSPTKTVTPTPTKTPTPTPIKTPISKTVVINITDNGFSPSDVTINAGDTVRFVNQSSQLRWPASGVHPTHELYPEKGGCINSAFDACRNLQPGESFSFTFNTRGTWPYHDHLAPSLRGKVIVQ